MTRLTPMVCQKIQCREIRALLNNRCASVRSIIHTGTFAGDLRSFLPLHTIGQQNPAASRSHTPQCWITQDQIGIALSAQKGYSTKSTTFARELMANYVWHTWLRLGGLLSHWIGDSHVDRAFGKGPMGRLFPYPTYCRGQKLAAQTKERGSFLAQSAFCGRFAHGARIESL